MRDPEFARWLTTLREAVSFVDPTSYRGISRQPFQALITLKTDDATTLAMAGIPETLRPGIIGQLTQHRRARERFRHLIGEDTPLEDYDEDLLPTHTAALEILSLLEAPHDYEIVTLAREPFKSTAPIVLGFDIGYWGGDHFSLICDTVVMPLCHPPHPNDFADLADRLRNLNRSLLFRTAAEAEDFRAYYVSRPWAETESIPGEFCIIQVGLPDVGSQTSLAPASSPTRKKPRAADA